TARLEPLPWDNTPNTITFPARTNIGTNKLTSSNIIQIGGFEGSLPISLSAGSYRICAESACATNTAWATQPARITNGSYLQLRATSSSSFNVSVTTTVSIGAASATFTVTTANQDIDPNNFSFVDQQNLATSV